MRFIAPEDGDHGGTWIAVNQFSLSVCLLNRYQDSNAARMNHTSHALLLLDLNRVTQQRLKLACNRRPRPARFASRFVPGARLPAYLAAGLLNTSLWRFSVYFFIAAAVWTPLLVGRAVLLGGEVIESALLARQGLSQASRLDSLHRFQPRDACRRIHR